MNPANRAGLERKIASVAASALSARQVVTPVEILIGIGWLNTARVEDWRRGRVPYLERVATANLAKLSTALRLLHGWARRNRLTPSETIYLAWTRDRHRLRLLRRRRTARGSASRAASAAGYPAAHREEAA